MANTSEMTAELLHELAFSEEELEEIAKLKNHPSHSTKTARKPHQNAR